MRLHFALEKAEQLGLVFKPQARPKPAAWQPIPNTKHPGGQRRRRGAGYDYRYPQPGGGYASTPPVERKAAKPATEPVVAHVGGKPVGFKIPPPPPEQTPHQFWAGLKVGDKFALKDVSGGPRYREPPTYYVVEKVLGDGELLTRRARARKTDKMKIGDDGKVARQVFTGSYGYAHQIPVPFEKPEPANKGPRKLPEMPANPHELVEQTAALYWQADDLIGRVKGPKAAKLLDTFADLVHRAAALNPKDDSHKGGYHDPKVKWVAKRVLGEAAYAKRELKEYLFQRQRSATQGERKEAQEKRATREREIAKPAGTPVGVLPRPEAPDKIKGNAEAMELYEHIRNRRIVNSYIIPDYPIGRGDRGQLKAWVEFKENQGWRVVTQTTGRTGAWFKPKPGQYQRTRVMIVEPQGDERGMILSATEDKVYLTQVRGQSVMSAKNESGDDAPLEVMKLAMSRWVAEDSTAKKEGTNIERKPLTKSWDNWLDGVLAQNEVRLVVNA